MEKFKVVLEVEKESPSDNNGMFYRYSIGDFKLWFSQAENGNIYSVGFVEDGDEFKDFDLSVYANEEARTKEGVGYYPNEFKIRPRSYPMTTGDAWEFMVKMKKACRLLDAVEEFFSTSKHYKLYAQYHYSGEKSIQVEAFPAKGGDVLCSQVYPVQSQDEALKMFREEHPEYSGCILVAENQYEKPLAEKLAEAQARAVENNSDVSVERERVGLF